MTVHELKCWPEQFAAIRAGEKTAEFRRDDRSPRFAVGDRLLLWEWEPDEFAQAFAEWTIGRGMRGHYTGERETVEVTHVAGGFGIPAGYVMLSFRRIGTPSIELATASLRDRARVLAHG